MYFSDAVAEIDLKRIALNIQELRRITRPKARVMAVIKADAYGHGAVAVGRCALENGADTLGVARIQEAVILRENGLSAPLLIFGHTSPAAADMLIQYDLTQTVFDSSMAEAYNQAAGQRGGKLKIHLKIDTGMGRLGFWGSTPLAEADSEISGAGTLKAIEAITRLPHLELEGIYTHFAAADEADKTNSLGQLESFLTLIQRLRSRSIEFPVQHAANSAAIIDLPETHLDMVRAGISLYGLYPSAQVDQKKITLLPAMRFASRIIQTKNVPAGFRVSYGGDYQATQATTIATVAVGYADGLNRGLSSRGHMLVHGRRAPIAGRVCMDLTMLDVGDIPDVAPGDEVVIFGSQGDAFIGADEVAAMLGTINYEVVTGISKRVPRVYIRA